MRLPSTLALLFTLPMVALAPLVNAQAAVDPIEAATSASDRTPADRERDTRDHTRAVLKFFGVAPGMTVVDMFAAGGYFSELIGHIVGSAGKVYLYNNAAYVGFAGDALRDRIASGRVVNVAPLTAEVGHLGIPNASVDMVLMVMNYHDLYFTSADWKVTAPEVFADINAMLKLGGVLAIVDHAATAGTGSGAAQKLHRIDESFARSDIESRGFKFTGSLDVLHNPADDHTKTVFDPAIRGHTDKFVDRFVKVEPTSP